MAVNWTISGEAGKTFPATAVSIDSMGIENANINYNSLEIDTLKFSQKTSDVGYVDTDYDEVDIITGEGTPRGVFATSEFLYWAEATLDVIMRSDLDGANKIVLSSTNATNPFGLHVTDDYIYWVQQFEGIMRMNLDGTGKTLHVAPLNANMRGLYVTDDYIYWLNPNTDKLLRADLDGTNQIDLVSNLTGTPWDLTVSDSYIYYTNDNKIERVNLDGSNKTVLLNTATTLRGIASDRGYIYFSDTFTKRIYKCNLEGGNIVELVTRENCLHLAIQGGYLYCGDTILDNISRFSVKIDEFNDLYSNGITDFGYPIELGQVVNVYRDSVRVFKGIVTTKRLRDTSTGGVQVDYTVSGPWWWLEQTPLTGNAVDQSGGTKERISLALSTGNLKTHIETVINRSITLGCDVSLGSIDNCFDIPQITLKQMSCSEALAELVRWIPDSMVWIDYTASTPSVNVTRRSTAEIETLTIGKSPCFSVDVNPRYDLETEQVVLTYVNRGSDGRTIYQEQIDGTTTSSGRRQILTVSGPELDAYLPNDFFDTYTITNSYSATSPKDYVVSLPLFSAAKAAGMPNSAINISVNQLSYCYESGSVSNLPPDVPDDCDYFAGASYNTTDGSSYSPTGKYILSGQTPPQWLIEQLNLTEVILSGTWLYEFIEKTYYFGSTNNYVLPSWASSLPANTLLKTGSTGSSSNNYSIKRLFGASFEVNAWLSSTNTSGVKYRDADYSFVSPPSGLAAALNVTQNFQPYEGVIGIAEEDAISTNYRGKVINLSGGLVENLGMKALVQGVSIDLASGTSEVSLGTPRRLSYQGLVNRFRRTASDNIVYL